MHLDACVQTELRSEDYNITAMAEEQVAKRARVGNMPPEMKEKIEKSLALIGEVEA